MYSQINLDSIRYFLSAGRIEVKTLRGLGIILVVVVSAIVSGVYSQGTTTGGFGGTVRDRDTNAGIAGARVVFTNLDTDAEDVATTRENGKFSKTSLPAGRYKIVVSAPGYVASPTEQTLFTMKSFTVLPDPFVLMKETVTVAPVPTPAVPGAAPTPTTALVTAPIAKRTGGDEIAGLSPRRGGIFDRRAVTGLPLGGTTLTRTFDELAFLVPGVNPPPQAIGNSVGPGVGGGVGTSGQFSVNGLRSRANNFTVDGSDNNDEDIGVRRQGFFSLVPQPIESIQEYQIITLLAPAEFGRNLGAQVNALSRSGGNSFHGTLYGLFSSDEMTSRNFFDGDGGNTTTNLTGIQRFSNGTSRTVPVFVDGVQKQVTNFAGAKDKFDLLQGGFAIGGRLVRDKVFFFVSGEAQRLNGVQERHYAVPTVEQRGLFGFGAQGLQGCFGTIVNGVCRDSNNNPINFTPAYPTSVGGDAVFSLFPFANDPNGIYGLNTYTQEQSADARGRILSGKIDWNLFEIRGNQQVLTARYNDTDDRRDLPDVGGALFSSIRPKVRTNNFSAYLAGSLSGSLSNELKFSWGRTRLNFEEIRDRSGFLLPTARHFNNPDDARFLLNAPLLLNVTIPTICSSMNCTAPGSAQYSNSQGFITTENSSLGPIGELIIAGFSPVGVDVFNFPQKRKNDTYQVADTVRWQRGQHGFSFGTDIRRVFLDSDLPRNSRPLVTFNGSPAFNIQGTAPPLTLASAGAATGFFQSLVLPGNDSRISLSYNQFDFFAQDEWRPSNNFSLNFGVRYEYNTVPKEKDRKIESTFQTPRSAYPSIPPVPGGYPGLDTFAGFQAFLAGRTKIYDADKNNFAPRIGVAWSPVDDFVIRGGYGIYYDQIIGSVVSQSRNVFPTFTTLNTGGGDLSCHGIGNTGFEYFTLLNPINGFYGTTSCMNNLHTLVTPGTLNQLNPQFDRLDLLNSLLLYFPRVNGTFFGATIPKRQLDSPFSQQYSIGLERRLFSDTFLSVAFVGTMGRNLLRFTTPNLGSNYIARIDGFFLLASNPNVPVATGTTFDAFSNPDLTRPNRNVGPISQFETTGRSRYDSAQIDLRGRLLKNKFRYDINYVYGKVVDDVSDVFDLAGAFALPQNSVTPNGEFAPANFDVTHRFTYNFIWDMPSLSGENAVIHHLFGNWQMATTGKFHTGQPFTVNTVNDVNFDGNLTDRLDNTRSITVTGDRRQRLISSCTTVECQSMMLARLGEDGSIPRNSFRAGSVLDLDISMSRRFTIHENHNLQFRVDVFNFINRANFGIPVRFLEAPGFGAATDTVTPARRFQLGLKYNF